MSKQKEKKPIDKEKLRMITASPVGSIDIESLPAKGKLICPNCGVATSFSPALVIGKGILSEYSEENNTKWGKVEISAVVPHKYIYGEERYAILVCQACYEFFVAKGEKYSDPDSPDYWSAVYPIQRKPVAEEIPEPVKSEFEEANLCFAVGAYRGCVSMCEVALEALWREQKVSGIQELQDNGIISLQLYDRANEVRRWGNVAKHELIPDVVEKEDAEQLLAYLEALLNAVYVEPKRFESLRQKRKQIEKQ